MPGRVCRYADTSEYPDVAPQKTERFRVTRGDRDTEVNVTGTTSDYPIDPIVALRS